MQSPLADVSESEAGEILLSELRSLSTSTSHNNLCAVLTWTEFKLLTYSKKTNPKNVFFLVKFVLPRFCLKLGSLAVTGCFCVAGTALIFPLCVCVMQEGKKRMQDEGLCSPGEHHCLVLYRRTKARDDWRLCTTQISQVFVSLKSVCIFSDIFILCKLIEVPDGSSVEIIW